MAPEVQKGQTFDLDASNFFIGMGGRYKNWKVTGVDIDAFLFLLNENAQLVSNKHLIFYNNLKSEDQSIELSESNEFETGYNDDLQAKLDFTKIDGNIKEISVILSIPEEKHNLSYFGNIDYLYVHLFYPGGKGVLVFHLSEMFSTEKAIHLASMCKDKEKWIFKAIGTGLNDDIEGLIRKYGINLITK